MIRCSAHSRYSRCPNEAHGWYRAYRVTSFGVKKPKRTFWLARCLEHPLDHAVFLPCAWATVETIGKVKAREAAGEKAFALVAILRSGSSLTDGTTLLTMVRPETPHDFVAPIVPRPKTPKRNTRWGDDQGGRQ